MVIRKPKLLALSVLITQLVGTAGSVFTMGSIRNWYPMLLKPNYIPPTYFFGPVWIVLYTLMGFSLYFVLLRWHKDPKVRFAVVLYFIHLGLNGIWSFLFFGLQIPFLALVEIVFLFFVVIGIMIYYYRIEPKSAYLLLPYLLWVGFAAFLNYQIWVLNV